MKRVSTVITSEPRADRRDGVVQAVVEESAVGGEPPSSELQ